METKKCVPAVTHFYEICRSQHTIREHPKQEAMPSPPAMSLQRPFLTKADSAPAGQRERHTEGLRSTMTEQATNVVARSELPDRGAVLLAHVVQPLWAHETTLHFHLQSTVPGRGVPTPSQNNNRSPNGHCGHRCPHRLPHVPGPGARANPTTDKVAVPSLDPTLGVPHPQPEARPLWALRLVGCPTCVS